MIVEYNWWLVLLSLVVAVQGAFAGLGFARQLAGRPSNYRLLLVGAAVTLTTAIWSMHFIGMLAAQLVTPVNYLVLPTLLSALIAVFFVGVSIFVAASFPDSRRMLWMAAVIMGTGIVAMHFTGMTALHGTATMHHDLRFVAASWVIGVSASCLAIRYAFTDRGRTPLIWASLALGLAISGMHYTAMAGMMLHPMVDASASNEVSISSDALAVVVALLAFGLSAAFLLMLVPEHPFGGAVSSTRLAINTQLSVVPASVVPASLVPASVVPAATSVTEVAGVTGGQLFRVASLSELPAQAAGAPAAAEPAAQPAETIKVLMQPSLIFLGLPVRQHGTLRNLPAAQVHAVRADAHYTWVFDGRDSHFCNLSITEVEARLGSGRFARVHRSHLVAIDHIARLTKSGDGGTVELDSTVPYSLPISRRQVSAVKAALEARV